MPSGDATAHLPGEGANGPPPGNDAAARQPGSSGNGSTAHHRQPDATGPGTERGEGTAWLPAIRPEMPPADPGIYRWGAPPTAEDARRQRSFGRSRRHGWTLALVTTGIVVAAALGGGIAYGFMRDANSGRPTRVTPQASAGPQSPAASAHDQALAVNELLQTGKDAHDRLPPALDTCDDLTAAVPAFQQLVRDREEELARAQRLQVDALQGGADLRQALIDSYRYSLEADRAYLAWAQEVQSRGCGGDPAPYTRDREDATAANDRAGPAKRRVIAHWEPIAQSQDLPRYRWQDL